MQIRITDLQFIRKIKDLYKPTRHLLVQSLQ